MRPEHLFFKHSDLCCNNLDFNNLINRMAHALMAKGIRKGDRMAVLMINCSTLLEFFYCAKNATFIAPVKHHLSLPELVRLAIPRRDFTIGHIEYVVERIAWLRRPRDL